MSSITIITHPGGYPTSLPPSQIERGHRAVLVDTNDAVLAVTVLLQAATERDRPGLAEIADALEIALDAKGVTR